MHLYLHPAVSMLAFFQGTQLNLFERFLTQAVSGIDSTSITSGMQNAAYVVLLIGFLWQVYQSALHGGDVRGLGANLIKYVVTGIVVMNYHAVFTTINQGFVNSGNWINSASGTNNLLQNWASDLQTQFNQVGFQKLWDLISAGIAGFLDAILIIVAYLLYPLVIVLFGFFYIMYGSILYIFGPIVIALMPLGATNRLAKSYVEHVFIWNSWPVLYGGFGALLSAVQMGQIGQMLNQNDFLGGLGNVEGSVLIGLASIIYSLAIAVIPFIAKKIVSGDVGSTAATLAGAAATALTAGVAAVEGAAAGAAAAGGGTASSGTSSSATSGAGSAAGGSAGARATASGNQPAPAQRGIAGTPSATGGGASSSSGSSSSNTGNNSLSRSAGDEAADSMRALFSDAVGGADTAREKTQAETGGTESGDTRSQPNSSSHSSSSGGSSSERASRGQSSRNSSSSTLGRRHGPATWGAYHAARLATQGVMGGANSVRNVAGQVAGAVSDPVTTAGWVGGKAGEVAGTAANIASTVARSVQSAGSAIRHPNETLRLGVQASADRVKGAVNSTVSTARSAASAMTTRFSENYDKKRQEDDR